MRQANKQSIEAFCRSESVSSALFYHWRQRLDIKAINSSLAPHWTKLSIDKFHICYIM